MELSNDRALVAIQGPKAVEILNKTINGVKNLTFMTGDWFDYNGKKFSTIESEKKNNPRLQVNSISQYVDIMNNLNLANPKMMDIAVPANVKGLTLNQL